MLGRQRCINISNINFLTQHIAIHFTSTCHKTAQNSNSGRLTDGPCLLMLRWHNDLQTDCVNYYLGFVNLGLSVKTQFCGFGKAKTQVSDLGFYMALYRVWGAWIRATVPVTLGRNLLYCMYIVGIYTYLHKAFFTATAECRLMRTDQMPNRCCQNTHE